MSLDMVEHIAAQVVEDTLPDLLHRELLSEVGEPVGSGDGYEDAEDPGQTLEVACEYVIVNCDANDPGDGDQGSNRSTTRWL